MTNLAHAIYTYRGEWNLYLAATLLDDSAPNNSEAALRVLETWDQPAESHNAAREALQLAIEFHEIGESDVIPAMMKAALGWMDCDGKRRAGE